MEDKRRGLRRHNGRAGQTLAIDSTSFRNEKDGPTVTVRDELLSTHGMLKAARENDARVFYASSSEVYGDPEVFPTPESYEGKVDPLGPRSCYEEGKRFGEALCKAYRDEYGVDVRIGRIFNSYGPRLRAEGSYRRVVSRFVLEALKGEDLTVHGDGSQTRSFCYVADTVAGLLQLMVREVWTILSS